MKCLKYLLPLMLISCTSSRPVPVERIAYRTSGIEQVFLAEVPAWANFSPEGACVKSSSYHYLDFVRIAEAYQLTYPQLVELQGQYNERLEDYFRTTTARFLKPVEEASFFSNSLEQVRGGVKKFIIPEAVREVDVIWLEGFAQDNKLPELVSKARANQLSERLPILFSSCLSKQALQLWVKENNLEDVGFYLLSAEWLNPYGSDLKLKAGLRVELDKILNANVKIYFISSGNKMTNELVLNKGEK